MGRMLGGSWLLVACCMFLVGVSKPCIFSLRLVATVHHPKKVRCFKNANSPSRVFVCVYVCFRGG